jgi:RNA polymerase sigma-54 factor
MVLLQPKLNLKVTQKQILTPGLVQMVSVLALNKLELRDMINAEMVENPVLEELDGTVPLLDDVAGKEEDRERADRPEAQDPVITGNKDPFDEIDFGSFFQDYLDPGYRTSEGESFDKPSFENFLSRPSTLSDHLMWQLGSMSLRHEVREAAELIIGNLNDDGYLTASDEELLAAALPPANGNGHAVAPPAGASAPEAPEASADTSAPAAAEASAVVAVVEAPPPAEAHPLFGPEDLREALAIVCQMDPIGVAARDLKECLLAQLQFLQVQSGDQAGECLADAVVMVSEHLRSLQNKQYKEISKAMGRPLEAVMKCYDLVRTLDPRPGLRYNKVEPRLIEPDVAFVKNGDQFMVLLNDEDVPQLRLNTQYKRLLSRDAAEKDVRNYVKERYKSAIQLIKNIEQRKQTILKVCYAIVGRQRDFLDLGIDHLKPMMIKEVAEEIGVHPSTVSRAVAGKYAHTPQGVFELRYFFSESVNGPEGGNTSLLILKRRVKKLIEEEDPARPYTDEQITRILQSQGIQVTRRTVAKYREDMGIPSTHQRRVKN